jgi:hypothetical protein
MTIDAVFSDIDGVLHSPALLRGLDASTLAMAGATRMREMGLFCWADQLEAVLQEADAAAGHTVPLILHSTWRKQPWASMRLLRDALGPLGHRLEGMTSPDLDREASILELATRAGFDNFLVLDDASAEFDQGIKNLVITNPLLGVSDPAVLCKIRRLAATVACQSRAFPIPVL